MHQRQASQQVISYRLVPDMLPTVGLTYALSLPVCHSPQSTCHHPAMSCAVAFIFLQLYLNRGLYYLIEARGLKGGVGFFGMGQPGPSPPARGFGECCKLPHLCRAAKRFLAFKIDARWLFLTFQKLLAILQPENISRHITLHIIFIVRNFSPTFRRRGGRLNP